MRLPTNQSGRLPSPNTFLRWIRLVISIVLVTASYGLFNTVNAQDGDDSTSKSNSAESGSTEPSLAGKSTKGTASSTPRPNASKPKPKTPSGRGAKGKEPVEESPPESDNGIQLSAPRKMEMQFGMTFYSHDNHCTDMLATIPFPMNWPEQTITVTSVDIPFNAAWEYRNLPLKGTPTARQVVMQIPALGPNSQLDIIFKVEVEKSFIEPPSDTSVFVIPKKIPKELNWYMGNSPMIEVTASEVKRVAKEIAQNKPENAWAHVEQIYDWVQKNIQYRNGPIRRTTDALRDKKGDCEEMTGIFVAICRASNIPARCVWIPDHCYPEFYLEDQHGHGHWFPCQAAGERQFGQMHEYRPILQKGDRFIVPEKQGPQHYIAEFFTCQKNSIGPNLPGVETIRDLGPLKLELQNLQPANPPPDNP